MSDGGATRSGKRERFRRRRSPLAAVLHTPQVLRALVRADEIWLVVLAAFVGACTGVIVHLMTAAAQFLHLLLFGIDIDQHLSATAQVAPLRALLVPPLGGLAFGLSHWVSRASGHAGQLIRSKPTLSTADACP